MFYKLNLIYIVILINLCTCIFPIGDPLIPQEGFYVFNDILLNFTRKKRVSKMHVFDRRPKGKG